MNCIHYELATLRRDDLLRHAAEHRLAARNTRDTRSERVPAKRSTARLRRLARLGVAARG